MSDNIEVVVRVRPPLPREKGEILHWKVTDNNANSLVQVTAHDKSTAIFSFDKVFDGDSDNDTIFNKVMQPIVDGALNGINGTVFAYGQTSSGKTHTMMGSGEDPGIIPLTIQSIFRGIEDTPNRQYLIRASYMEIYNEQIADLLVGRSNIPGNKGLAVREDLTGNIYVADLKEECVTDESKLLSMMQRGNRNRQVGCTNMNDRSSRSHTIFRIIVESQTAIDEDTSLGAAASEDDVAVTVSHLNLVDLAGSENAAQTGASGDRLKEGGFINKSLFMLGRVISQLSDGEAFINYRDSKLTRILQCSLGGNARTAIICTITPASLDQTYSTLRFASRAKNIKNKPVVNEVLSEAALLKRYSKEIKQLQLALEAERQANKADEVIQVKEKLDAVEQMNEDLKSKVRTLNEKLVTSSSCRTPGKKKEDKASRRKTWAAPVIKGRATSFSPLDLASINAEFSFPFNAPLSATSDDRLTSRRCGLPQILETETMSECSFFTATDEFSNINSSILKRLDQSFETRLDASTLDQSSASDVFALPSVRSRPKVSFASPSMVIAEENSALPASVTRRKRKGSSKLSAPDPPAKAFRDAEAQTDTSLLPKINLLSSPRTPHRCSPIKAPSSPVKLGLSTPQGETPRKALRFRIEQLNECLKEKDGCMSQLNEQLAELQELHEFVEADHVFREESLLAKLEQGSDDDDVVVSSLRSKVASLTRSLQDSELLLLDANKKVSEQTQQLAMSSLAVEELTLENARLAAQSAQLAPLQQQAAALAAENDKLKREISEQQSNVASMTKDKKDFDILLELKLEQQHQTEARLRKSLQDAWDELARLEGGDATAVRLRMEKANELEAQAQQLQEQLDELGPLKLKCEEQHQNIVQLEALLQEQQQSTRSAEEALAEMKAAADLALRDTQLLQVKAQSEADLTSQSSSSIEAEAAALQSRCAELEKALQSHQAREVEVANALSKLSQLRGALAVKADKETDLLAQIEELQSLAEADRCSTECKNCKELMETIHQLSSAQKQVEGSKEDRKENDSTLANVTGLHKDVYEENDSSPNEAGTLESIQSDNDPVIPSAAENVLSHDLSRKDRSLMDMAEVTLGLSNLTSNDRAELGRENATSECTVTERKEEEKTLLVQLEETISSTRKEAEELRNQLSSSVKKVEELQADLDEANKNLTGVTAEKDALVEKMEEALSSLQKEVSDLTIEKKSLEEKLEAASETTQPESMVCSEKKTFAVEPKSAEVKTAAVEEISTQGVASSPSKSGPIVKLDELKEASLQIVSLNEEITNLKAENEKLCIELEEIESLNLNHLTMKSEVEELTEEIERLKLLKEDLSRGEYAKSGETVTTPTDSLLAKLRELEVQNEKLVKEVSSLEAELCALRTGLPLREDGMSNTTEVGLSSSVVEPETVSDVVEKKILDVQALPSCSAEHEATVAFSGAEMKGLEVCDSSLIDPEAGVAESHNEATGSDGKADLLQKTVETLKNEITDKNAEIDALQSKIAEMFAIIHEKNNQSEPNVQSNSTESRDECENDSKSNMTKDLEEREEGLEAKEEGLEAKEEGLETKAEGLEAKEEKIKDQPHSLERPKSSLQTPKDEISQEKLIVEPQVIELGELKKEKDSLPSVQESEVLDLTSETESKEQSELNDDEVKVQQRTDSLELESNSIKHLNKQTDEISQQVNEQDKAVECISRVDLHSEIGSAERNMDSLEDQRQEDLSTTMCKIGSPVEQESRELMLPECEELKVKKEELQGIQLEIEELKVKTEELQGIQQEIEELKVKKEELQGIQQKIEELRVKKEELQSIQQEIEELNLKKEEIQGIQVEIEELKVKKEELEGIQLEIEELKVKKEELQRIQQEIKELNLKKEELQGIQQEIDELKVKKEELLGIQQEIEELNLKKEELQGIQQKIEELRVKKEELQSIQQEIKELNLKKEEIQGIQVEIEELKVKKEELRGIQLEIEELKVKKEELQGIQLEIDEINIKTEVLRSIQQEFEELKEKKEALKSLKQEIAALQKQNDERLRDEQSTQKFEEEQREKLLSLQQDIEELAEQREELLQEVSELSDKRKELQYSLSARRRRSTLNRRVSSAPSAREELYESMLSVCGDDSVMMRGSVSHNPTLASVSHRLLQSLSVLEDSLMASPAGADVTAASHDRTDVPEELTVDQLSDIRDQLLSLQRALLITSNSEAAASLANVASCAVYAEHEAEVQTWTLMEAFRCEYHLYCHTTQPASLLSVTDEQDGDIGLQSCAVSSPRAEDLGFRSKLEELNAEISRLRSENKRLASELHGALSQSKEHSSTSVNYEAPIEEVITVKVETEQSFSEARNESVSVEDPLRTDISVACASEGRSENREFISDSPVSRPNLGASTCVVKPLLRLDTTEQPSDDTYMSDCDVTMPVSFPRDVGSAGGGLSLEEEMRMASMQDSVLKPNETCDQTASGLLKNVSPVREMPSQRDHLFPTSPSGVTDCSIQVFGVSQASNDDSTKNENDHNTSTVTENTCEPYNSDELSFQNSEDDNAASEESMRRLSVTPVHPAVYARLLREKERLCDRVEALLADLDDVTASFEEKMTKNGELEKRLQEQALCVEALKKQLKDRGISVDEDNVAPVSKSEHCGLSTCPDSSLVECTDASVSKLNNSGVMKSSNDSLQLDNSDSAGLQPVGEPSVKDPTEDNLHTVEDLKQQLAEANLAVEELHCLRWRVNDLEEQKLEMTNELALMRAALSSNEEFNDKNLTREETGNGIPIAGENSSLGEESSAPATTSVEPETQNIVDSANAAGGNVKPCEDGIRVQQADIEANVPTFNCSRSNLPTPPAPGCTECESLRVEIEITKEQLYCKNAEIDQLCEACKNSQTNCQRLENELSLLRNSKEILQSEVESLRNDAAEREHLHLKKCSDFEQQEEMVANLKADIVTESLEHQKMLDELKKTLCAKETELAEVKKQVTLQEKDKDSYVDSLLAELGAKNGNLQSLSDQLTVVKKDLAEARLSHETLAALCKTCTVKLTQLSSLDSDMPSLCSSEPGDCESSEFGIIADAVDYLVDKYIAARKETDKLKDDVQNLRLTVDRKSADMTALQETHEEEIKKVLAMIDDKEMEKEEAIKEERKQKEECQVQLRHELESKRKQLEQLEEASIELEQEMKVKENHIENINIQLKGEEMKVLELQNDLSAVRSEMALLADDNEKRKLKIKELTEELAQLKESSARLAEVQKCLDEAWSTIEELKLETSRTAELKERCEEDLKNEKEKSSNLEHRLDFVSKRKGDLESKNMQLKEDVDRLTEVVEKHEFELSEKESKFAFLEAEHSKCQAKITEKDTKLFVLQTSNASFEQKLVEKNEKCETLAMDLAVSNKNLVETKQQLAAIVKEHSACKEQMPAANAKLKQFDMRSEELTQLKLKLFEKEQESATLSTECEKRVQELQALLKEATKTKEAALAQLTEKLEEEEAKMASLRAECQELSLKHANILSSVQVPTTLYEMVPEDQRKLYVEGLVRVHQGKNGSLDIPGSREPDRSGEIKELQRQVTELKEQVQQKEIRCKQLDEELDDVVQHFENRIASYRSDMAGMPAKILALEASNDKLTAENKNLTSKLNRLQQNTERLQEEKQQLEGSLAQLQNESKSAPGMKEELGSHTADPSSELTECLQKLREKESECQELEDAVQYYEKQIALYKTDRKSMRGQLDKLQSENKAKLEEHTSLMNKITSLEMKVQSEDEEKERLRRTLQETMSSKKKLEEDLIVLRAHKHSGRVTPDNAGRGGVRGSSSQRVAREQQVAQFESLSNAEKEIKELREKLHFAETKATRYREELRRLQNTGPLDSTVCQLRSTGAPSSSSVPTAAKPPPIMPLSSPDVHSVEDAQKDSSAFSYEIGSHMVLSSQVLELRREIYQLEKTKKTLESENKSISHHLNHYKTKAQEWKISSLAHQKASAKWKDEVERLKKMQVASERIISEDGDNCLSESHSLQSTMPSKNSNYLPDAAAAQGGGHRDVLKELNSVRSGGGGAKEEPLRKGVQASENKPPSDANVTLREPARASHHVPNTPAFSNAPDNIVSSRKGSTVDTQGYYTSAFQATDSKVSSSMEQSSSSKPSTLSAAIIKGLSTEEQVTHDSVRTQQDSVKRGVHGSSALYSGSSVEAASKGCTPAGLESVSSGCSLSYGPQSGRRSKDESNAKYFRRESKSKNDEDCKTQ